jgi:hypothetical protein
MSTYRVADGHDVALLSLGTLALQPSSEGVKVVERNYAVSGNIHEHGLWIDLRWNMIGSVGRYQTLLTAFGLHNALTNEITIYCPDHQFAWNRYNGLAIRPEKGVDVRRSNYFIRDVIIIVKNLVLAA